MKKRISAIDIIPFSEVAVFGEGTSQYFTCRPWIEFREGDILEVPFPYSDLSGFKTRPALVLAGSRMDLTIAFFSTHLSWAAFEDVIFKSTEKNGLVSVSLLRVSKLFSIHPRLVFRKLGRIEEDEMDVVRWSLKSYFSNRKAATSFTFKDDL
jgi:mRNA interferase MazF